MNDVSPAEPEDREPQRPLSAEDGSREVLIISTACILFLFSLFAISTAAFLVHIPMTPANSIVALAVTLGFVALKAEKKIWSVAITAGLIIGSIAVATFYYDGSWDGNAYHKLSAGLIKSGWNPIYEPLGNFANSTGRFLRHNWGGFWDGFPKGSYIMAGSIYSATGLIESGKAYTLISMLGAVGIIAVLLKELGRIRRWQSYLVAALICVNTVTLNEVFTFYNDGLLSICVFVTVFSLVYLSIDTRGRYRGFVYWLIFMCACIGMNLKFSGIVIFGVIFLAFLLLTALLKFFSDENDSATQFTRLSFWRTAGFFSATSLCAFFVFGLASYVHNIAYYHNPFYPMGPNSYDTISTALPAKFTTLPTVRQFTDSIFSSVSDDPALKIPFTFDIPEAKASIYSGLKFAGGWGIWFSGILILSFVLYCYIYRRIDSKMHLALGVVIIITVLPAFAFPYLNQARYWPLPFIIPPFILFLLFVTDSLRMKGTVLAIAIFAGNLALPLGGLLLSSDVSFNAHRELSELASVSRDGRHLTVALGPPDLSMQGTSEFNGMIFNLEDAGVDRYIQVSPREIAAIAGTHGRIAFMPGSGKSGRLPLGIYYVIN